MKRLAALLSCILILLLTVCLFLPEGQFELVAPPESTAASTQETEGVATAETETSTTADAETTQETAQETTASTPPTQPVTEPENEDFVRIIDYIPQLRECLAYATAENFTGIKIYEFSEAYLRYGTVKKLMTAAQLLADRGYGLVIWDGYRPCYAQEKLWEICPDPTYVSKPGTGSQSHCRGLAVDVTLYDMSNGALLEMPTGFDDFSAQADRDYSDCTDNAARNAAILEEIMESCGFKPYSAEWWHFSDTDSYPVEYEFDPANVD